jgi:hypothetical protein
MRTRKTTPATAAVPAVVIQTDRNFYFWFAIDAIGKVNHDFVTAGIVGQILDKVGYIVHVETLATALKYRGQFSNRIGPTDDDFRSIENVEWW